MNCKCCGKKFPEGQQTLTCSRCGFTVFNVIGDPNADKVIESLVDGHRKAFLKQCRVSVASYHWGDQDGMIALKQVEQIPFGTADLLMDQTTWLPQSFARIPGVDAFDVALTVQLEGQQPTMMTLRVPTLPEKELVKLGIHLDRELKVSLLLKNATSQSQSEKVNLLAE